MAAASLDILVRLEKLLDSRSSEPWSCRRLPTPTAVFPAIIDSEEEDGESELVRMRCTSMDKLLMRNKSHQDADSFLQLKDDLSEHISKQIRALRKKLQQIEMLEEKQAKGHSLDCQQISKLRTRSSLERSLIELGVPAEVLGAKPSFLEPSDGKVKNGGVSKRQRRKNKKQVSKVENASGFCHGDGKVSCIESSKDPRFSPVSKDEEECLEVEHKVGEAMKESSTIGKSEVGDVQKSKGLTVKKKNKKGGLSMFLSGALDDTPKNTDPPPSSLPKSEGPAWGGAQFSKGSTSLRQILDEQKSNKEILITSSRTKLEDIADVKTDGRISLSSFLPSSPIPVGQACSSQASDAEKGTPPWASSGTPPLMSRPSLRDIQMQQGRQHQSLSHSPKTQTTGFAVASGQGSPSDSAGINRWFKPEVDAPSSIRAIQIEEKAMKDLKRFYSSVKIVKNQS